MKADLQVLLTLAKYLKPYPFRYGFGVLICAAEPYLYTLWRAAILSEVLSITKQDNISSVVARIAAVLFIFILLSVIIALGKYFFLKTGSKATFQIQQELYQAQILSPFHLDEKSSGERLSRFQNYGRSAETLLRSFILDPLSMMITIIMGVFTIWRVNLYCALAMVTVGIVMLIVNSLFINPQRKKYDRYFISLEKLTGSMNDLLADTASLRLMDHQKKRKIKFYQACDLLFQQAMSAFKVRTAQNMIGQLQASFTVFASLGLGFLFYRQGWINLTDLPVIWVMGDLIVSPISSVGNMIGQMQKQLAAMSGIDVVLNKATQKAENSEAVRPHEMDEKIFLSARSLSVNYVTKEIVYPQAFQIPEKGMTAIIGSSGKGKSSFIKLLLGMLNYSGSCVIKGRELRDIAHADLRMLTSYVPQSPRLFDGSLYDNLMLGKADARINDLIEVLEAVGLWTYVSSLPQGIHTSIGEFGKRLSGGQRQRIAIARALLKKSPVLLLDEPSAQLDNDSKQYVYSLIKKKKESKAIIVVTHDSEIIAQADYLIALD